MTRIRILIVLVIALLAGGGLAAGTYRYLQNVPTHEVSVATKPVVVANSDLALGTELRADDLLVVQFPASSIPEGAFENASTIVGRSCGTSRFCPASWPRRKPAADCRRLFRLESAPCR